METVAEKQAEIKAICQDRRNFTYGVLNVAGNSVTYTNLWGRGEYGFVCQTTIDAWNDGTFP